MRAHEILRPIDTLTETPFFAEITGRDGLPYRAWKNPSSREFAAALSRQHVDSSGLRGILTQSDLYVWQSANLLHVDFERSTGVEGAKLGLRRDALQVNDETVDQPE